CIIESCTADTGTHQTVSLHLTAPADVPIGGLTVFLDYPEGHVRLPVVTAASGVSASPPNDRTWAVNIALIDGTLFAGSPANGAGPMLTATFEGGQGAPLPAAADYRCTITDASDETGTAIDLATVSCTVTVP